MCSRSTISNAVADDFVDVVENAKAEQAADPRFAPLAFDEALTEVLKPRLFKLWVVQNQRDERRWPEEEWEIVRQGVLAVIQVTIDAVIAKTLFCSQADVAHDLPYPVGKAKRSRIMDRRLAGQDEFLSRLNRIARAVQEERTGLQGRAALPTGWGWSENRFYRQRAKGALRAIRVNLAVYAWSELL